MACRDSKGRFISEKKKAQLEQGTKKTIRRKLEMEEEIGSKKRITEQDYVNKLLSDVCTSTENTTSRNVQPPPSTEDFCISETRETIIQNETPDVADQLTFTGG